LVESSNIRSRPRVFGHYGVFVSAEDLIAAIEEYVAVWNKEPKPFVWTATVDSIVEKLKRCPQTLEQIKPGCTLPRSKKTQE
jgi:hypothetical protein